MKTSYLHYCLFALGIRWSSLVSGQCPQNKYGPDCTYDCHCGPGVSCDPQTGCGGNCAEDWLGNHCQARNVALRRPTAESPKSVCRTLLGRRVCDHSVLAVDGRRGHKFHEIGGCSHTGNDDLPQHAQWNVTLDQEYDVYWFIIDNRNDCLCSPGWYGQECNNQCTSASACLRCDDRQRRCIECVDGRWGEDCQQTCCCPHEKCKKNTGKCFCPAGYKGDHCDTPCMPGEYGHECTSTCGYCAEGTTLCSITSGECPDQSPLPRCQAGYKGTKCHQGCTAEEYGPDCRETCGYCAEGRTVCNRTTGECPDRSPDPRCQAGYQGIKCNQECSHGFYGVDCLDLCGNCSSTSGSCHHVHGTCISCEPGWNGTFCKEPCLAGYYGDNCGEVCGSCRRGVDQCNAVTGECPSASTGRCAEGFTGELCKTECPLGQYGIDCRETCGLCAGCRHECDRITGICPGSQTPRCGPGRKGIRCNTECSLGEFGADCTETCGQCAEGQDQCDRGTGTCPDHQPLRCAPGWGGDRCKTALLNDTEALARLAEVQPEVPCIGVVLGSSLAIAATAIVIIITIVYLMKRSKQKPNSDIMLLSAEEPLDQSAHSTETKDVDSEKFPKYNTLPEDEHL
ncbi:multiple epidermal growth factor-like domains protein 10 isoform X2 [Liolophura sinensis]|uniref:multiple epidermal growth factor-like domains protein 10 isoform X2 n=1 Tax=Liolophura sinensis TaxID=3198878 RepID=UPI0031583EEC